MIKTIALGAACILAVLWLPAWVQVAFFVLAVLFGRYRLVFLVPALYADVRYAPTHAFALGNFTMTYIVLGLLFLWFVITTKTRLGSPTHVQISK